MSRSIRIRVVLPNAKKKGACKNVICYMQIATNMYSGIFLAETKADQRVPWKHCNIRFSRNFISGYRPTSQLYST